MTPMNAGPVRPRRTLLPIDSDHAWGEFISRVGWVDAAAFRAGNDAFYAHYKAGALDIDAYIAFAAAPLRERSAAAARRGARALHARGDRAGDPAGGARRWSQRTASAATCVAIVTVDQRLHHRADRRAPSASTR